ncbi:MAG: M3 family oligoendopeptidase [Epsilonproteobacteria bacterium]|nr:M3 family oligoendopeptidase [Campylobacterota bacterium]
MTEWNLKDLFKSDEELEKFVDKVEKKSKRFQKRYKNKIKKISTKEFLKALEKYEDILNSITKAATYAFLKFAQNSDYGNFYAKYSQRFASIEESLIFFELEFNKIAPKKQKKIIKSTKKYRFYLQSLKKEKKHQLSKKEEKILLKKSLTSSRAFSRLFDEHFSRMKFKMDGKRFSEEEVLSKLYSNDRSVRKKAARSLSKELKKHTHLTSYIFNMVKTDLKIECDIRRYKSVEEPRHIDNKITQKSVDALINTTTENFDISKEYYEIKKEILGYKRLYDYDRYAPYEQDSETIEFSEAKKIVLEAFKSFDERFYKIAKKAFDEGWCDVYPKDKKRGGAFSHPASTDTHPYVMLNYTGQRRDIFTIAHELGHAIHQYLSRDVGYLNSDTPLTTAETASVFAEMLLFDHIKQTTPPDKLLPIYGGKLEDIFATLFRQIIFTLFERRVHAKQNELKAEDFSEIWMEENQKMFPKDMRFSKGYEIWWSYIPHFIHTPFYCYAYSYGQLLVLAIYALYKQGSKDFKEKYIRFLSSGGSKSPKKLVKTFGFDIEDEEFWRLGINETKKLLEEFKKIRREYAL